MYMKLVPFDVQLTFFRLHSSHALEAFDFFFPGTSSWADTL